MFIDEARIEIIAGKGGDGSASFRREKFAPKGGPDGGDGGRGGNVFFVCDGNCSGLGDYSRLKKFSADDGQPGGRSRCYGKGGKDLYLRVPPGTLIYEIIQEDKKLLFDFIEEGQEVMIAKGGRGGFGNVHFASAVHQTPRYAQPGGLGQKKTIFLELKLLADVGLVGLPNVGKSTLLQAISSAKPDIADYPFTTLAPNLGVVNLAGRRLIIADLPGLIEGASVGRGLGLRFLRHVQRTKILVYILDGTSPDIQKDFQATRQELKLFDPHLLDRPAIVVVNKCDLISTEDKRKIVKDLKELKPIFISAEKGTGLKKLLLAIGEKLF